jgi:murein DD-endopeptidase MepM/ murein hydrolase activator NlpD
MSGWSTRLPDWAAALHAALPAQGTAQVILTDASGVRYLELSRQHLGETVQQAARREVRRRRLARRLVVKRREQQRRVVRWLAGTAGAVAVVAVGLWVDRTNTQLVHASMVATLSAEGLADPLSGADRGAMGVLQQAVREVQAQAQTLSTDRAELKTREAAFRAYVDATRHLLQRDNDFLLGRLADLGLKPEKLLAEGLNPVVMAKGGVSDGGPMLQAMQEMLDESQQEALLLNADLQTFLRALPAAQPLSDMRTTSSFGFRRHPLLRRMEHHNGADFVSDTDPTIRASMAGTVVRAGSYGGYGQTVIVRNEFGVETLYAHMARVSVRSGQRVPVGAKLGVVGSTGLSSGPHLHYEVRYGNVFLNPAKVFALTQDVLE